MLQIPAGAVEKIRRDHDYLIEQVHRIKGLCTESDSRENCLSCPGGRRNVCQGNVEQLILNFVEMTLKHNLIESVYMEEGVPKAHRIAHMAAHVEIAEQLKSIRVIFSEDGNCVLAIEGIDRVMGTLLSHFEEFDLPLESYLLTPA